MAAAVQPRGGAAADHRLVSRRDRPFSPGVEEGGMTPSKPVCRSCGSKHLREVLSLGRTPLANALLRPNQLDAPEPAYPLDLAFCPDCTLVQLLESVPPEDLFLDYCYFSSFSDTMVSHAAELSGRLVTKRR